MKQFIINAIWGHVRGALRAANIAEGTHAGMITKLTDAAITTRHLLVKVGSDSDHIAVCGASDRPRGLCDDEAGAAEEPVNVNLLGCGNTTQKMVASDAIADDVDVFTAADGKIQNEPSAAGTYYKVGRSMGAASTDGDEIEVEPCHPIAYVVAA
jgi:hypothetical protein